MARTARSGVLILDEGGAVAFADTLDFRGAGVVATDQGGGTVRATIAGGGGGGSLTVLSPTSGTINDTNTVFGLASQPTVMVVNGDVYEEGRGYSWNGGTSEVTLDFPAGTGGDVYGLT